MNIHYNVITEENQRLKKLRNEACLELNYVCNPRFKEGQEFIDLNNLDNEHIDLILNRYETLKVIELKIIVFVNCLKEIIGKEPTSYDKFSNMTVRCDRLYTDEYGDYTKSYLCVCGYLVNCSIKMSLDEYIDVYSKTFKEIMDIEFKGCSFEDIELICQNVLTENELIKDEPKRNLEKRM